MSSRITFYTAGGRPYHGLMIAESLDGPGNLQDREDDVLLQPDLVSCQHPDSHNQFQILEDKN